MNDSSLPHGTRPTLALSVTGLTKHYDSGFTLDDVTFDLPSGYIMGLVGPNGAGKSTLIKLILNMTTRDAGRIEVLGLDAMADEERAKEQLGVVLDSSYFIEYMTVDAVERTSRPMYPLWDHNLFDAYLRRFGLGRNKKIKDLSRGMQMKLMLAVALSHDAKLLILDEPTSGLDVLSRDELMDILSDYVADGEHSVIFSTHITADLERCADFLTYITHGMLYYSGPKDEFEDAFRLVKGGPDELTDGLQRAMVGIRTYATGFDALVRTQDIPHIGGTDGLLTHHPATQTDQHRGTYGNRQYQQRRRTMNTTANANAMTAILRQISLDWNRTISYGRSYLAIFFAYAPGVTCLMAATGSTLDSVAGAVIGGAASGFLMLNITLFSYEQMNNHHWMNGIVPINRNHQILGRFAFLIVCDLVAGLEVAVSIACASILMHEPVKVTAVLSRAS